MHKRKDKNTKDLDGTCNASDSSDVDSHEYLDLANTESTQYNTRATKRKYNIDEVRKVKIDLADLEIIQPDVRVRKMRQKVPDDESIDIDKIVKDDMHRYQPNQELKDLLHPRKSATEAE